MKTETSITSDPRRSRVRKHQGGWVLMATLVMSTIVVSVTVTYARHAVLAKKSLEVASGASPAEEASRSGLDRTRERMREGDLPGTEEEGLEDIVVSPNGEIVTSEREVVDHDERRLRVRACGNGNDVADEANLRAHSRIDPGCQVEDRVNRLRCETGEALLLAGNLHIISGAEAYVGTELAGLYLLEPGATLTLEDVVLRGTIITRAGLCDSHAPQAGANRPTVQVYGGLRLLAGTEVPDVAMCAPDARFIADSSSRVEVRGMCMTDEFEVQGRGAVRGMVVSKKDPVICTKVRRPGHGRGLESWPEDVVPAAEVVRTLSFPFDDLSEEVYDAMDSFEADEID